MIHEHWRICQMTEEVKRPALLPANFFSFCVIAIAFDVINIEEKRANRQGK
jgi:hypothetical protein